MLKVFNEVNTLDKKCYDKYLLSEDILMEHAALSVYNFIFSKFKNKSKILIVCGSGNNGADGSVLARQLDENFDVSLYYLKKPTKDIALLQMQRTKSLNINELNEIKEENKFDVIVDCIFGTGLNKQFDEKTSTIIKILNELNSYKIACDVPSGIGINTSANDICFDADTTITMGALKKCLFGDNVKDIIGNIVVANLGISKSLYEGETFTYLLEKSDLKLPNRNKKDTNKGTFGHLFVVLGEKTGAGIISCETALGFGVGLVSAITNETNLPYSIMYTKTLGQNASAIALGMGLGKSYDKSIFDNDLPLVVDADLFYDEIILNLLNKNNIVLTPHPKEFCSLLKLTNLAKIDIKTLQNERFKYVKLFTTKYPKVVLLLKGANVIISKGEYIYINNLGTSNLSFGGSGDILAGLIGSLLAQGYESLEATLNASLAHTIAANNYKGNDYSLNPKDLIEEIKIL